LGRDFQLTTLEKITVALHNVSRLICISDVKALHLDSTNTIEEKVPITIDQIIHERIKRVPTEV